MTRDNVGMAAPLANSTGCVPGPGVNLDLGVASLYKGCKCSGQCDYKTKSVQCICNCPYNESGCLSASFLTQSSVPIIECNSNCTCDSFCLNRTTQKQPTHEIIVVNTENKGVGIASTCHLQQGTFVGEYVGEIITSSMATERLRSLSNAAKCFIVQYREHMSNGNIITTNVDATSKGNFTRYINHSCEPNLIVVPVRSDSIVPRLCFFTCVDIKAGEELCFSYFGMRDSSECISVGNKRCYCGSPKCIGYLPLYT